MTVTRSDLANAIRVLTMDAVQKANSGHPGMPMGMADIAEVLWNDFLVHNPANPHWPNRDRFILSNGHGSMLQYALLHLSGYDLSLEDLKQFRQWHSKTPGHPEYRDTPGVETTTGPLGQGLANGVGMALAEQLLGRQFNHPDHELINHYTYVFLGDGCLMEGISHEACSLAGVWGLHKLICFYDDNNISIDGHVDDWFGDDTPARFEAYGWHVIRKVDGHDPEAIKKAIVEARSQTSKPTLICCKTVIGHGSPNKAGTHDVHGAALGADEVALTRKNLGWTGGDFEVPEAIYRAFDARAKGESAEAAWKERFAKYQALYPQDAAEFQRRLAGKPSADFRATVDKLIADFRQEAPKIATRVASGKCIQALAPVVPEFIGGSADLTPSNNTRWKEALDIGKERTPSLLALSRQNLPALPHSDATVAGARRGGYVLKEAAGPEAGALLASGSEVELALAAQAKLADAGVHVRVVSMPCLEVFDAQDAAYRESVLPTSVTKRLAIEAGSTGLWYKYVGLQGAVLGIDRFGASAPAPILFEKYGFTVEQLVQRFQAL